tara:strand:- start:1716 stop:1862 length:147 start_codon:yes stop_codon:yes gene_type:complete
MMLADRLKKSLEEVMQLSVLEIDLWIGYLRLEQQASNRQMGKLKNKKR